MAPEVPRSVRRLTFGLLILAAAAAEIAAAETRPVLFSLGLAAVWVGLAAMFSRFARPPLTAHPSPPTGEGSRQSPLPWGASVRGEGGRVPPRSVLVVLLLLAAAPFVIDPLRRQWTGDGYPLELRLVFALRNLGLGLAAFAAWPHCLRLACVVSLFLILFAVSLTTHPAVLWLLGLYSAAGSGWLTLVYWARLRPRAAGPDVAVLEVQADRPGLPWLATLIVVGVVGGVLAVVALGPQRAARGPAEWLSTSGGTGGYDPFARGGLNDGDDEVKGDNPRSTGMVETDALLNSPLPSLYDMVDDMYGEPFKVKERERTIGLDKRAKSNDNSKPPADNLRPNREFPTARQGPRQPRDPAERAARALFEVEGRTPLHVRATAFDSFNAATWQEAPPNRTTCLLDKEPGSCWMRVRERGPAVIFAGNDRHQIKITAPLGSLVPTPPHLLRFRIARVDQERFFAWRQDRILGLSQRRTPAGVLVETESRPVDPRRLTGVAFPRYTVAPANLDPEVAALAHRWADGEPRGWPQIVAVVEHLRAEYVHDPAAHAPEGCADPLADFLLRARRGPDYQFATAAALLLRALGYQTRLVSGFYASPEHYDPETRHTPVVPEDLHFWPEVRLPSGDWLVIEPTPGYDVLGPSVSWSERATAALLAVGCWLGEHAWAVGVCLAGVAALWWKRRELLDALAVVLVRHFPGQSWRQHVRRVLWLLERRGRWAGRPRPTAQTPSAWLRAVLALSDGGDAIRHLTLMAEWCAYAPDLTPPWQAAEVQNVCRRVLDAWTWRRWRTAVTAAGRGGSP